ncbi:MAG: hypothetical protein JJE52_15135 [Acidimicrobiia bacterium]|nr:hypothetical protein [Acidimicrobiia bacterium]
MPHRDTQAANSGERDYDTLTTQEQEAARAQWVAQMDARISDLDLVEHFCRSGDGWVEADGDGNVVHRAPRNGSTTT